MEDMITPGNSGVLAEEVTRRGYAMREAALFKIILFLSMATGLAALGLTGQTTSATPKHILTAEHLRKIGLHLPSNVPTVQALLKYQQEFVSSIQTFNIEWDSLNGQDKPLRKEVADTMPLSYKLILIGRKQNLPGPLRKTDFLLSQDEFVIVGITSQNEVRGLIVESNNRVLIGESLIPGEQHSSEFVLPKKSFDFALPNDPEIVRVLFLQPRQPHGSDETWKLESVGVIAL
jgi:hypothetical protein